MPPPRRTSPLTIVIGLVLLLLILGMVVPAIGSMNERRCGFSLGSQMRQLVIAMLAYASEDENGKPVGFPTDAQTLITWSEGDVTPKMFTDPRHPAIARPIVYVRPVIMARSSIPVLVSDPACTDGRGSLVAYADGHTRFVEGRTLWEEARRLAALPKATVPDGGIEASDWTTLAATAASAR